MGLSVLLLCLFSLYSCILCHQSYDAIKAQNRYGLTPLMTMHFCIFARCFCCRSGWQPPKDTGLWQVAEDVRGQIEAQMNPQQRQYWLEEDGYFNKVTDLSGKLYPVRKDERRNTLQEMLAGFGPPRDDLYLPTNPDCRVMNHIPSSGACMQSAAKVCGMQRKVLAAWRQSSNCSQSYHIPSPYFLVFHVMAALV